MCEDQEKYAAAQASAEALASQFGLRVATEIVVARPFYAAEDYHQKYRLRRHAALFSALVGHFGSEAAALASTAAAKLNAYVAGALVGDGLAGLGLDPGIQALIPGKIRQSA